MTWLSHIITFFIGLCLVGVIAYATFTAYGWERIWPRFYGPADQGDVTFSDFEKGPKPNQALVCPKDLCDEASVDFHSPVYAMEARQLRQAFMESLKGEPNTEQVDRGADPLRLRFVERTSRMKFPDTISVEIIPLGDGTSAIAAYSRSQIGETDFGVNLVRLKRWFDRLEPLEREH
jgi:uncharacterized protein (DUF1499 family)